MTRGRKPKPRSLKLLLGNSGRRPINKAEPKPVVKAPSIPSTLGRLGKAEWRRVAKELSGLGLLTGIDRSALMAYCEFYERFVTASKKVGSGGLTITTPQGMEIQSPYVGIANTAAKGMKDFMTEFGMTPSSRTRIQVTKPTESSDLADLLGLVVK